MKNSLEALNSRSELAEERTVKTEDSSINISQSKEQREKRMVKNEQSLKEMWGTTVCVMGVPKLAKSDDKLNLHIEDT